MSCSNCPAKALLNNTEGISFDNGCGKLTTYDWMENLPSDIDNHQLVEIRFKNTRKEFYVNQYEISLKRGDYVTVSTVKGHNVGQVTLMGRMAMLQFNKKHIRTYPKEIIYRKASLVDMEKWNKVKAKEKPMLIASRKIVNQLNIGMKISDVEFQSDGSKAIFYYIAEGRVDFRELIKVFAKTFNCRIEMKQIGARQEAAMIGGIGSCGNELCCSSWRTDLASVSTNAARIQELPHNIQKLTGQCGKLKCCLMYELDTYIDAKKDFPDILLELETESGIVYPVKKDLLKRTVWYSLSKTANEQLMPLSIERIKEIIMLNKKGTKVSWQTNNENSAQDYEQGFVSFESDLSILNPSKWVNNRKKRAKSKGDNNNIK